jgi:inorganic pyrophosphatase
MNEKAKTPIESLADLLAEMTERAMKAERRLAASQEDASNWYQHYTEAKKALAAQIEENEELHKAIANCIEKIENGEQVDE